MLCALAGALYVPQVGIINPSEMQPSNSIEMAIWVAVGGRATLLGAVLGAWLVNGGKSWLTAAIPSAWLYALGALFVAVTLFLPDGIVGLGGARPSEAGRAARDQAPPDAGPRRPDTFNNLDAAMSAIPVTHVEEDDRPTPISNVPIPEAARPPLALWVENLSVSFDGFKALTDVTLTLEKGELRCLIGPNGAGKTTLMDCITGKTRPDSGAVYLENRLTDLTKLSEVRIAQLGIGRKFQRPTVFQGHTVYENCELALQGKKGVFRTLFARLGAAERTRIDEILELIGLQGSGQAAGRPPGPRAEAVAGDRHAARAVTDGAAGRRADRRDDPRRDGADGRAAQEPGRLAHGRRGGARHGVRPQHRAAGDGAAPGEGAGRRADGADPEGPARHRGLPG